MAFLTSIHYCPVAHWLNKTKRELYMDCYNTRLTKFVNDCVSRNCCRINITQPNQMILVSFFSEDNVLSDEIKICYFFEYHSNKNRAFLFFFFFLGGGGTPGIYRHDKNTTKSLKYIKTSWYKCKQYTNTYAINLNRNKQKTRSVLYVAQFNCATYTQNTSVFFSSVSWKKMFVVNKLYSTCEA